MKKLLLLFASVPTIAFAQPVAFISNGGTGTPVYVSSANPLPTTGGGGGGGGGAVYGPTAAGSNAANPPILLGGTQDGTGSGIVQNLKVNADGSINSQTNITGGSVTLSGGLTPVPVTSTNGSTTITTGGVFQSILASNGNRKACLIQNPITATETLFVFFGPTGSATLTNSFAVAPGAAISCTSGLAIFTDNVAASASTTGHAIIINSGQ